MTQHMKPATSSLPKSSPLRHTLLLLMMVVLCWSSINPLVTHAQTATRPDVITPDGGRYFGPLVDGLRQGRGKVVWDGGTQYEGNFVNGVFEGEGKLTSPTVTYEGEFKTGQYSGHGQFTHLDGRKYIGEFALGQFQGKGAFTTPDGQVYEGTFVDGTLSGPGRALGNAGSRYDGEFKNWLYEGQGVLKFANGDEYKGGFAQGLFDGEGTLTYAKPHKDGTTHKTGVWRYGTFQDKEAAQKMLANVETALYNQRALLQAALAGLAPSQPEKINLYLLAVAGDGGQEVFHRETEFVKTQFDRDFHTRGRSMILANSRNTVSQLPMATLTSVRESIQGVAERMDKGKDILFLYLTSHGSADHRLSLDQDGINLRNLSAKDLGSVLKESGIRWKVIVVSACYSGGFIEPLQDDHTLVITASRPDRRSFGCADENDFTYFGRAFFKESLPHSKTFTEAFQKAKALILKWEDDDFQQVSKTDDNDHSEPQISTSPLIEEHLQRWRGQMQ